MSDLNDPTEEARMALIAFGQPERDLAKAEGQRWDTQALTKEFEVLGFLAPFVHVRRRSDGQEGSLEFTHYPRWYFNWVPDKAL